MPDHTSSRSSRGRARTVARVVTVVALVLSTLTLFELSGVAGAAVPPVLESGAGQVTSDSLPTVQVNGVVWDQVVSGNTVYVVGEFTSARPAGAPLGTNETPKSNILAYDITTGQLRTEFTASLNRQAKVVVASPDGSRIYVGGEFTTANGVNRYRIAAFDATTGALVTSFGPTVDYRVSTMAVSGTTLYVGGAFGFAGPGLTATRTRLAAFSTTNGALLDWAPSASAEVLAMVMSPDQTRVFVGGRFQTISGTAAYGMGAIDATTGAVIPWSTNTVVRNAGSGSAILSLSTDGTQIYGTGYSFNKGGNLEGAFSADPNTGAIKWIQDCHGDTYDGAPINGFFYTVSHAHYCGNVGGFPQSDPWATNMRHSMAWTTEPGGTIGREPWGYNNWQGTPAPSLTSWFPEWTVGTYTGQSQATWTVSGNSQYVVVGGEFPRVNNTPQQGLARFAVKPIAPSKDGPRLTGANFPIKLTSNAAGQVRISFPANIDRDDSTLTYRIVRDGNNAAPIHTTTVRSVFWDRPIVGYTDTGLNPGQTYTYRVFVTDPDGNQAASEGTQIVASGTGAPSTYADTVMADGARMHWRLDENSGASTAADAVGFRNMNVGSAVTFGSAGALANETSSRAATFSNSSNSRLIDPTLTDTMDVFSVEAWVRTNSTRGGRIMGLSTSATGTSGSSNDRVLYMTNNGRVMFGVNSGGRTTIESQSGLNDNQWHHVVATLGSEGMHLYVDGKRVASRGDIIGGNAYNGYWRVGADTLANWTSRPTTDYFAGQIDEPAVYYQVLNPTQVASHYSASGRTPSLGTAPADAYGSTMRSSDPYLYYRLSETSGSTANDTGIRANTGDYVNTVGRNASGAVPGNAAAQFNGNGFVASRTAVYNPSNYSVQAWFNTTTNSGGQLIGFGNSRSGNSSSADRQVYLRNDGRLAFGMRGGADTIVSEGTYKDGQWHHVVATQGAEGMRLYVDGQLAGANTQPLASPYSGYWRIGGDSTNGGSTASNFTGRIDEAVVHDTVLTANQVLTTFLAGGGQLPNVPPTASFTNSTSFLALSVDATSSSDLDGTVTGYAWNFGDGTTATGVTANHTYAAPGTYTVTLTVTDDDGATGVLTQDVTVAANQAPTAAFTPTTNFLGVSVDATASSDLDGTITGYSWNFGDGATAAGATANHTYGSAGTYTVTLTVTDDLGATGTVSHDVTVAPEPPNVAPTASFTTSASSLVLSVNGSGSSDSDGTITGYAWNFGDGATATGATATHSYAVAGTYTVTLTVTDDDGATGVLTQDVTVAGVAVYADDTFERSVANGFGTAPTGGAYTYTGTAANFTVAGGEGRITLPSAGVSRAATLSPTGAQDVESTVDFSLNKTPTGGGTYIGSVLRKVGNSEYRLRVRVRPGVTNLQLLKVVNGVESQVGATQTIAGLDYTAGTVGHLKFRVTGSGTSELAGKVWFGNGPEPAAWQLEVTDSTPALQGAGSVGVHGYISGSSSEVPVVLAFDNFKVRSNGGVEVPNLAPTAAFTPSTDGLAVGVDATASNDPDGTIAGYAWNFGDGATATGATANHTYGAAGTYTVTLTVTDDDGDTGTVSHDVTVSAEPPANVAPTAAFTSSATFLALAVDGSTSGDSDGTIAGYAWNFGDGATATGATANHTYGAAGTYTVTLTVTDDDGDTGTVSHDVTVSAEPADPTPIVADLFERSTTNGLGTADLGGAWTTTGTASWYSVSGGKGRHLMNVAGRTTASYLNGVSAQDVSAGVDLAFDKEMTGGGVYSYLAVRRIGTSEYRVRVRPQPASTSLTLSRVVNGVETAISGVSVPGLIYTPGDVWRLELDAVGAGTTTLTAKVWNVAGTEPALPQLTATDTTAALQAAGGVGLSNYLSGTTTNAPLTAIYDNLTVLPWTQG